MFGDSQRCHVESMYERTDPSRQPRAPSGCCHRCLFARYISPGDKKYDAESGGMKIFSGNANQSLAKDIAAYLGINLGRVKVGDGEQS